MRNYPYTFCGIESDTMSKSENKTTAKPAMKTAEGFEEVSLDLIGFYDYKEGDNLIFFVPIDVILMDSNLKKNDVQALIRARLTKPCRVKTSVKNGKEIIQANKGDMIGIWYKPGMRNLATCAGAECQMYQEGSTDTGQPSEMLDFRIGKKTGQQGKKLPIAEDRRDKSVNEGIFGLVQSANKSVTPVTQENYDNTPF